MYILELSDAEGERLIEGLKDNSLTGDQMIVEVVAKVTIARRLLQFPPAYTSLEHSQSTSVVIPGLNI